MQGLPPASGPPRKLDIQLEGLAAFQEGAATLKAGDGLALRTADGRLECVTEAGAAVGLVPADKRSILTRGPWAGTVRSVKRRPAATAGQAGAAAVESSAAAVAASEHSSGAAASQPAAAPDSQQQQQQQQAPAAAAASSAATSEQQQQPQQEQQQQQQQAPAASPAQVVVQVLVRFVPEEQRWERRGAPEGQQALLGEEDTARLSREQLEALAASEEIRWMLRDERLQQVVADIDAAPDRERALLRALQAPNFKEFADKVLGVVAPAEEAS